jgi:hypothetical protein
MYVSMGVGRMADNAELKAGMMKFGTDDIIGDKNVQFAERGILPDERVTEWIIERADEWIKDKTSDAETRVGLGEETEGELVAQ